MTDQLEVHPVVGQARICPWLPDATDAELVAWATTRPEALAELFTRHLDAVMAVCRKQLRRQPHHAEDATFETFARLVKALPTLKHPDRVEHWLRRVARNVCWDHLSRASTRLDVELLPGTEHRVLDLNDPAETAVRRMATDALLRAVSQRDAELLTEHYLDDRSVEEMARRRGANTSAITTALLRARERARVAAEKGGWRSWLPLPLERVLRTGLDQLAKASAAGAAAAVAPLVAAGVLVGAAQVPPLVGPGSDAPLTRAVETLEHAAPPPPIESPSQTDAPPEAPAPSSSAQPAPPTRTPLNEQPMTTPPVGTPGITIPPGISAPPIPTEPPEAAADTVEDLAAPHQAALSGTAGNAGPLAPAITCPVVEDVGIIDCQSEQIRGLARG